MVAFVRIALTGVKPACPLSGRKGRIILARGKVDPWYTLTMYLKATQKTSATIKRFNFVQIKIEYFIVIMVGYGSATYEKNLSFL